MKQLLPETRRAAHSALVVDFTKDSEVVKVLPSGPLLSSQPRQWNGVHLSYYQHPPHEFPEIISKQHLVLIHLEMPTYAEQWLGRQSQKAYCKSGSVLTIPAHMPHYGSWDREHRYLILSIDPAVFLNTVQSAGDKNAAELIPHFMEADPLVHGIGLSLKAELESNRLGGRLYVDSLCTTLLTHLLRHYTAKRSGLLAEEGGLAHYKLQQVIEYIEAYLDQDLALGDLAAIAQLSPNYFTQLFKQSTGFTPHQYVIRQRVERAKRLLLERKLAIADIALEVGFSHQSHLNRHFKRWVGVTPRAFIS